MDLEDLIEQAKNVDLDAAQRKKDKEREELNARWDELILSNDGDVNKAFQEAENEGLFE